MQKKINSSTGTSISGRGAEAGSAAAGPFRISGWTVVRWIVGLLLAVSGFEKLISPYQNFQFIIEQYQIVGSQQAALVAQILPWAELLAGVFFAVGLWTRVAGFAVLALFGIFLVAVGQALIRRLPMDECGCFGELISIPLPGVFTMDMVLGTLTLAGLRKRPGIRVFSADAAYDRA